MTVDGPGRPVRHARQLHALQTLLAPQADAPSPLYFAQGSAAVRAEAPMTLAAGECLIADGYFNSFYLMWWITHTDLGDLAVKGHVSGRVALRAIGHRPDGSVTTLAEWTIFPDDDPDRDAHPVWSRSGPSDITRLHLELTALDPCTISDLAFVTETPPRRDVTLSVGLCTFNREGPLVATMAALVELKQSEPALRRIILVNQGQPFHHPELRALVKAQGIQHIRQPNLGGTGGFTRTMIETLDAAEAVTHHLLMDDDIQIDARLLRRALQFLAYSREEIALGGQSIELEDRVRLHEAGAVVGPDWLYRAIGAGVALDDRASLGMWDACFVPDYVGWWMCILPVAAMRRIGLPAPFFLHSDDVEYGLRLKAAGVPTIPLPGLGVWHSSVRFKHAGVMNYYDLRNMLIMSAVHPEVGPRPGPLMVLGWVMFSLLVHRYRAALASLIAVEDYLAGPDIAFGPDSGARNRAVRDLVLALPAPEFSPEGAAAGLPVQIPSEVSGSVLQRVLSFATLFLRMILLPGQEKPSFVVHGSPHPTDTRGRTYLLALDPESRRCLVMRCNRPRLIRFTLRALGVAVRFAFRGRAAAACWQEAMPQLRSRARWAHEFDQPCD